MDGGTVERSIWIAATPERVWQAVTDPALLSQWFGGGAVWEIPLLAVGATALYEGSEVHIIEVLDPPRQFTLRWEPEPPATPTLTTFLLAPEAGGTRVTVRESGYELLPNDIRHRRMAQTDEGYRISLDHLAALLEGRERPQ
ncbi:MAG TPA: SRPBCC domain-containing protein [Chloroflexaceae bacterium]|nr:SRPBCC domain-containing protein [Chloroflexaceae bacterium]